MLSNLIFRKYLSEKDKVLVLANSILEAHIDDTEEDVSREIQLKAKQTELERLNRKMDNYIEMRAEGDLGREMFRNQLSKPLV